MRIDLSRNGGSGWETIVANTGNDGNEDWGVSGPVTAQARVRVVSLEETSISGTSDANFTIFDMPVTITSPNGGEAWTAGNTYTITWSVSGGTSLLGYFWLRYSLDGGQTWPDSGNIGTAAAGDRSYRWSIPSGISSSQCRIMVRALDADGCIIDEDISNANLTISPALTGRVRGIDVLHLQGSIGWNSVHAANYEFAFVKATDGTGFTDDKLKDNMRKGQNAGLLMGPYHFAYPQYNNAEEEALLFIAIAGDYLTEGYLRPVLDIEDDPSNDSYPCQLGQTALSNWIHEFMDTVKHETGVEPILHVNSDYANNYLDASVARYGLWIAHRTYDAEATPNTGIWDNCTFWQYSDQGSVPGIAGNVDLDLFDGDRSRLNDFIIRAN